jgi:pimeloyl-ACP methyl ester carboxylesterase
MMSRRLLFPLLLALATGCALMRPARTPMERVSFRERGPAQARGAIVLLPGFGDGPDAFHEHGFVDALGRVAPEYDVYAADAHFGYYRKRTLVARLERDVVGPLRARGYRELWVAGTSLGGFGAVGYVRTHPERVAGVLLFAPYMGPSEVIREVSAQGLCKFDGQPGIEDSEANFARANFAWLRRQACDERKVSLFLAVGLSDRLLVPDRLLGSALDPTHMVVLPGGHGWSVWTPALERLATLAFDKIEPPH